MAFLKYCILALNFRREVGMCVLLQGQTSKIKI